MQIAILESDLRALDCALEMLSSAGHFCFGLSSDESLPGLLKQVSVDLVILDWAAPDAVRYDTLRYLAKHESLIPIILCVTPGTPDKVIVSGLESGANICLEKPLGSVELLAHIHALGRHSDSYSTTAAVKIT
jgi:DNA-binding response OmpR family regulator